MSSLLVHLLGPSEPEPVYYSLYCKPLKKCYSGECLICYIGYGTNFSIIVLIDQSSYKGRFPLKKIRMGSERIGTDLNPRMAFGSNFLFLLNL